MRRRRRTEDHLNHEAWAIPYGDLMTLLLAVFVVLYAVSRVNIDKYRMLSDSMVAAFRSDRAGLPPGSGPSAAAAATAAAAAAPAAAPAAARGADDPAGETLQRVADAVDGALGDLGASQGVVVRRSDRAVEVDLSTDIIFPSGAAALAPNASGVLEKLAEVLRDFPNPVRVEGHTDDRPISTALYPSNWELSSARAARVVEVLSRNGVDPTRLTVQGFGEFRPIASNATSEGRNANRRVLLVIESGAGGDAPRGVTAAPAAPPAAAAIPAPVAAAAAATAPSVAPTAVPRPKDSH
jgi:chemotaxis protein MotB